MAVGIAGDSQSPTTTNTALSQFLNTASVITLLTNMLVELRVANSVTTNLTPIPPISLDQLRTDENAALISGNLSD